MKSLLLISLLSLNMAMAKDLSNLRCVSQENKLVLEWKAIYGELQFSELETGYEVYFDDSIELQASKLFYVGDSEPELVAEISVDKLDKVVVNVVYPYGNGDDGDLKVNGEYLCE